MGTVNPNDEADVQVAALAVQPEDREVLTGVIQDGEDLGDPDAEDQDPEDGGDDGEDPAGEAPDAPADDAAPEPTEAPEAPAEAVAEPEAVPA